MEPYQFSRRILLCVTGLSPQIITETLYALAVERQPAFVPTDIHLITTAEGAERARLTLLSDTPGWFHRLCRDYDLSGIRFDDRGFHILQDAGRSLADIRTLTDNEAAADMITAVVRQLTADAGACVHASIAGGRKTMGFYLGYAMSLFGRAQDRLSHVLVSGPFESNQQFYYPPRESQVIFTPSPEQRPLDARDATVTLAEIPFVRLREGLPDSLLEGQASYSETVRRAQLSLSTPELVLDRNNCYIRCGDAVTIKLSPVNFAWFAWFARRAQAGLPAVHWTEADAAEFLTEYLAVKAKLSEDYEQVAEILAEGMTKEYFEQRTSRLKGFLKQALGSATAAVYQPTTFGRRPRTRYGLALKPQQIRFESVKPE